jgi:hypothetical protein
VTEESPTGLEMFESVYVVPPCLNTVQCIFGCGSVIVVGTSCENMTVCE